MKSILHIFASFWNARAIKLNEPILESFHKDLLLQNFIATSLAFQVRPTHSILQGMDDG